MPAISANLTLNVDGSTALRIGAETVRWNGSGAMDGIFVWAPETSPLREVTLNLQASEWFMSTITTGGNSRVTLTDATSGDDRHINAVQLFGTGDHIVTLTKTDIDYLATGEGDDRVTLGTGWVSQVNTNDGDDTITSGSVWLDVLQAGHGANVITIGSGGARSVMSGEGADRITLIGEADHVSSGRGNDQITLGDAGAGSIDAGRGVDRVVIGAGGASFVSLGRDADTLVLQRQTVDPGAILVLQGGGNVSTPQDRDSDTLNLGAFSVAVTYDLGQTEAVRTTQGSFFALGFENVIGGSGADRLSGNDEDNRIAGGRGRDQLQGDLGADTLVGGGAADRFIFTDVEESSVEDGDLIIGFNRSEGDRINLQALDANMDLDGNQAFVFLGAGAFTGVAGQLRAVRENGKTIITADLDGDSVADFGLSLNTAITLTAGAFML